MELLENEDRLHLCQPRTVRHESDVLQQLQLAFTRARLCRRRHLAWLLTLAPLFRLHLRHVAKQFVKHVGERAAEVSGR